jgi:hypothetical protein
MKKNTVLLVVCAITLFAGCKKKDDNNASPQPAQVTPTPTPTPVVVNINSTPQFTGTINGTAYSLVNGATYTSGVSSQKQIGSPSTASYASLIGNDNTNQPYLTINKGTMTFNGSMPDTASFDAFFPVGSYTYSMNYAKGIEIDWIDPSGNQYSTSMGSGNQSNSSFKVTAKQVSMVFGYYQVKIMATFNCTLYNISGTSITLTNGTYVGSFEND